jgi:hypothetical protein
MIKQKTNYVEYAMLLTELDDAREHLEALVNEMRNSVDFDEADFAVDLGHIYAHLNRAWHARNQTSEVTGDQHAAFSEFPRDLKPVG